MGCTSSQPVAPATPAKNETAPKVESAVVKITVVSARGLRNSDALGKCEPYVTLEIANRPESRVDTPKQVHAAVVTWSHAAQVSGYKPGDSIVVTVKENDLATTDLLGKLVLSDLLLSGGVDGELRLADTGKDKDGKEVEAFLTLKVEGQSLTRAGQIMGDRAKDAVGKLQEANGSLAQIKAASDAQLVALQAEADKFAKDAQTNPQSQSKLQAAREAVDRLVADTKAKTDGLSGKIQSLEKTVQTMQDLAASLQQVAADQAAGTAASIVKVTEMEIQFSKLEAEVLLVVKESQDLAAHKLEDAKASVEHAKKEALDVQDLQKMVAEAASPPEIKIEDTVQSCSCW